MARLRGRPARSPRPAGARPAGTLAAGARGWRPLARSERPHPRLPRGCRTTAPLENLISPRQPRVRLASARLAPARLAPDAAAPAAAAPATTALIPSPVFVASLSRGAARGGDDDDAAQARTMDEMGGSRTRVASARPSRRAETASAGPERAAHVTTRSRRCPRPRSDTRALSHEGRTTATPPRSLRLPPPAGRVEQTHASRPDVPATGEDAARAVVAPRAIPMPSIIDPSSKGCASAQANPQRGDAATRGNVDRGFETQVGTPCRGA
ncbi:predicted protein [Micromonas commoda]|uniref:Uncharacterized protein n=1 Tax=Micromonas commoda (strain RCC299 / NOUM17 / CCMP2709) TaxID=296587 RepID=C1DYX4_MICCC|nr:predicted protein [Micromonas commoda]ACO61019.1 predicted protein [Micromonas commoda]|eukprot:XP_002499761.1 predicted protein [Micromonas commoda]